jgi:hypothetical protein
LPNVTEHQPLPEPPPSIETIDAAVKHIAVVVGRLDESFETFYDRFEQRLREVQRRESGLQRVANQLSRTALRVSAGYAIALVAPTPARFALIVGSAFVGGFGAQLLMAFLVHR